MGNSSRIYYTISTLYICLFPLVSVTYIYFFKLFIIFLCYTPHEGFLGGKKGGMRNTVNMSKIENTVSNRIHMYVRI